MELLIESQLPVFPSLPGSWSLPADSRAPAWSSLANLRLDSAFPMPTGTPRAGELGIRILATSAYVDEDADCATLQQTLDWRNRPRAGFAGVVETVGADVDGFAVGDEVFGIGELDSLRRDADAFVVPRGAVAQKPAALSMADSASFAHAAASAWQMLFKVGRLERGETVLVIGGETPIGRLAAQFATVYEVRTVVMTSQDDAVVPRDVDRVIDATTGCLEAQSRLAALIVDTVGGPPYRRACKAMRSGCMLVSCVERPSASSRVGVQFHRVARASAACLSQMVALLDAGRVEFDAS